MQLIDSHCHIDFPVFDHDRPSILEKCKQTGISDIIVPAVSANTWDRLLNVCQTSVMLHPALGMHPMFMQHHQPEHIELLSEYVSRHQPIAIGEIGLDFYIKEHDKQAQITLFEQQLLIAKQTSLPVILHIRKAYDQVLTLLKKHKITKGIVHAFSGSEQQAQHFIKQGFLLGVGGVITYEKATKIRRIFQNLPLSNIVLETDAPDMPLYNSTLDRNSPTQIPMVLEALAELRNESAEAIANITSSNVNSLFFS